MSQEKNVYNKSLFKSQIMNTLNIPLGQTVSDFPGKRGKIVLKEKLFL